MGFFFRCIGLTAFLIVTSSSVGATELAILRNGFTIRHDRRESIDTVTRLYFAETPGSYVDIATEEIERFESEEPSAVPVLVPTPIVSLREIVTAASKRNKLDPDLIMILIGRESAFHVNAISPKGAQGLMQLMPATASQLGVQNPMDPQANVEAGTRYLRQLLDRYSDNLIKALAAYNAGPQSVDQYRGVPPYAETRAYVAKIIGELNRQKRAATRDPGDYRGMTKTLPISMPQGSRANRQ